MTRFFAMVIGLLVVGIVYEAVQGFRPFDLATALGRWWFTTGGMVVALLNGWRP